MEVYYRAVQAGGLWYGQLVSGKGTIVYTTSEGYATEAKAVENACDYLEFVPWQLLGPWAA